MQLLLINNLNQNKMLKVRLRDKRIVNQMLDLYRKVTRADIQRVAKTYLNNNARVILYYLPKEK